MAGMNYKGIGQFFRAVREGRGLDQHALAHEARVHRNTIQKLEVGRVRRPSFEAVAKIAAVLHISLDELDERYRDDDDCE